MGKVFIVEKDETKLSIYFKSPTHQEVMEIDMEFRKIYSIAIRNEVITQAEAIKQYRQSGAWTKEDDTEVGDLMLKLSLLEVVINDEKREKKERREAALSSANLRSDLLQKMSTRTGLFDHTAESFANQQKLHKFIMLCTCNEEDDENLFTDKDNYQTFINENEDLASQIYKEAYFYDFDLPDDVSESWAEVQFLKNDLREDKEEDKEEEAKKTKTKAKKSKKKTKSKK